MRFVDHDPAAARLAAMRCREAADELRRTARWFEDAPRRVTWCGGAREAVVAEAALIAVGLRCDADSFDRTAELLEGSAHAAERAEAAAWRRHLARPRAVVECAPAGVAVGAR